MTRIYKSISELLQSHEDGEYVVTIGNFDGFHVGHKQLIQKVLSEARERNLYTVVFTFSPHPSFILKNEINFLLTDYDQRNELILAEGIDFIVEHPFNRDFSTLGPEAFLKNEIFVASSIKKLILGYDFVFGANKSGNADFIKKYATENKKEIERVGSLSVEGFPVSSTRLRECIRTGNVSEVKPFLGRNFSMRGNVVRGKGRGKIIGFPTANIQVNPQMIKPSQGVYLTQTKILGMLYYSLTNIGLNPTFNDLNSLSVETHILDFDRDIYGERLEVIFLARIRNEIKFSSVNELIEQIKRDINLAKEKIENEDY